MGKNNRCFGLEVNGRTIRENRHSKFLEIYAKEYGVKDYKIKEVNKNDR